MNMQDTGFCLVYVTTATPDEALKIGRAAVEARLAACANIGGGHMAIYRWQGAVEQAPETSLWLKTRSENFQPLSELIRRLHNYSCPCIIAVPIVAALPEFLAWLAESTAEVAPDTTES